jgi:alkanesulfonate monooxygenase SsuD/methylene tetrahydromethanopterin reductase-like flavin-dependent oxidoreductase (luciferase family)
MLAITAPYVAAWNVWFSDTGNDPSGIPPLRAVVDDAARAAERDPSAIERTVAVLVRLPGGLGRIDGSGHASRIPPLAGDPAAIADGLRAYAGEGIEHVQIVMDPITVDSVRAFAPVLADLDRD